jgi:diguanylate cyclase (GGDEF)-like protein/PAS domain S-box-containing protein
MHAVATEAALYRLIVENAIDLIVRGDAARRRTYVSPSSREILGYTPEELLGNHAYDLVHPDDLGHVAREFGRVSAAHPKADVIFRMRHRDGHYLWMHGRYRHLPEDDGILAILRDITAQKLAETSLADTNDKLAEANAALLQLAHQDGLTGLANRRRFDAVLDEEWRRALRDVRPLGLVLLDVDAFKAFNDCHGHPAGDDCLRRVGQAIMGCLHRAGDHAARYGGEEFAVLLPTTDLAGTVLKAEQMRAAVEALDIPHRGWTRGRVTISAGATARIPAASDEDGPDLVATADRLLYQAKEAGRNCVRGHPAPPLAELQDVGPSVPHKAGHELARPASQTRSGARRTGW